jgi:hypothetical protein
LYVEALPGEADAMADKLIFYYPHRQNKDGSFDSICLTCFATITTAQNEYELWEPEGKHVCIPSALSQRAFDRRVLEKITQK